MLAIAVDIGTQFVHNPNDEIETSLLKHHPDSVKKISIITSDLIRWSLVIIQLV